MKIPNYVSERRKKWIVSFMKNRGYDIDSMDFSEAEKIISEYQADLTRRTVDKKHKTMIALYGDIHSAYEKSGNLSKKTRHRNFLIDNGLRSCEELDAMSSEEIEVVFKKNFEKYSNHGKKIRKGIKNKHGNKENIKKSFKSRRISYILKYFKMDKTPSELTEEEENELIHKWCQAVGFTVRGKKIKWMKTHLENIGIDVSVLTEDEIKHKYSEYYSERMTSANRDHVCGYKSTLKGWYEFENLNKSMFFRSSWELKVFKLLDSLIASGFIKNVNEPDRVKYTNIKGLITYYYPDISYVTHENKEFIVEIKPERLVASEENLVKIKEGKRVFGEKFFVLTENEIFGNEDELKKHILGEIRNEYI